MQENNFTGKTSFNKTPIKWQLMQVEVYLQEDTLTRDKKNFLLGLVPAD